MKKFFSYLLAICMILSLMYTMMIGTSAAEEFDKWDGTTTDTAWFSADKDYFELDTAAKLAGLAYLVNEYQGDDHKDPGAFFGKTFVITKNIDLGGHQWTPIGISNNYAFAGMLEGKLGGIDGEAVTIANMKIGTEEAPFTGTFDGNGHKISNFYQNTWEIQGDYDGTYYKDAMGLFGYVVGTYDVNGNPTGGIIKNLAVDNFSSDGEFTPTGVIAAYAENATFENIAITNCNPRVYNTGNGGIVGIAGRTNDQNNQKIILKNITVDNSNKISALWGSWDVACGGLVGMFRGNADGGNGTIHFENCHVSAIIDVYNDVCANYQYYAYRYSGMIIGYTFGASKDYVTYMPTHSFFGYRFVSITATDEVRIKSIESIPVTSITKEMEIGRITTGDASVNQLISNTYWGQLSNYLSVPTDCPQRNERLGWTADTQVFTETGTFFANTTTFFHKWMRDMRDSQSEVGGFPGVAPWGQYGNEMMRLGWADAGVIVPWTVWKQFGDKQIIDESWASMEFYMNHVNETKYDHVALRAENGNFQYADWLSYEALESTSGQCWGPNGVKPEAVHYWSYLSASYWALDATYMADMAKATGRDAARYEQMAAEAKAYIQENFLKADGSFQLDVLNTMQTPALFALKNGLVEGDAKAAMVARLRKNFEEHDNCLQTGFLGTSILMGTLTDNGMEDIAYELLFQRKNPSWLYSVDNGATTIWERWNSYMVDEGMGPKGMNSFNHYAYGCVCEWIWETCAGIASDPANPGFKHIIMKPIPDKRLGHIDAEYQSAAGLIKSAWKYEGDQWIWDFTIPEGATASVTLPGETEAKEYTAGSYQIVQ